MEVILLEKVGKMGVLGDTVNVKSGYARNFLFPTGKAVVATADNVKVFEDRRAELVKAEQVKLASSQARADQLAEVELTVTANAGEEGKLFGSIGTRDIAEAVNAVVDVALVKSEVSMPDGAIRSIGEYEYTISLHSEVTASVKVVVVIEE